MRRLVWSVQLNRKEREKIEMEGKGQKEKRKVEKPKANAGKLKRGGTAAGALRIRFGLTFLYLCIYEIYALLCRLQREWLKTNTRRRDSSRFYTPAACLHARNKKNGPCWGCGNTCHKFTVIPYSAAKQCSPTHVAWKRYALFSDTSNVRREREKRRKKKGKKKKKRKNARIGTNH